MQHASRDRFIRRTTLLYAVLGGLWILLSDRLLAATGGPDTVARLGMLKGLAFVAVTTGLLHLALHQVPAQGLPRLPLGRDWQRPLLAALSLLVAAIAVIALLAYRSQASALAEDTDNDLRAVARLKVEGIGAWLAERRADADAISHNPLTLDQLAGWLDRHDEASRLRLKSALEQDQRWSGLDSIMLLDAQARPLLDQAPALKLDDPSLAALRQALDSRSTVLEDLHREPGSGKVVLGYLVPLYRGNDTGGALLGVALMRIRADRYLFPYLGNWPMESRTGETVLMRREGDEAVFLNPLRYGKHDALSLRLPLSTPRLPAAAALRSGSESMLEGLDYRQEPVLFAALPVPGTRWMLGAKVDKSEALAGVRHLAMIIALLTLAALAAAVSFIAYLWQQQRLHVALRHMTQAKALRRAETHFGAIFEQAAVGIAEVSAEGQWLRVNPRMCRMLGLPEEQVLKLGFADTTHPQDLPEAQAQFERLRKGEVEHYRLEVRYRGAASDTAWASSSVSAVRDAHGGLDYAVVVVQDVTALKEAEASLRQRVNLQEYLGKIADTLPGTIYSFRLRPDGSISMPYTSPNIIDVCGLAPADVAQDAAPAFARIHPDDLGQVQASIAASAQGMSLWQAEFRFNHPRRGEVWIEGRSMPEPEPDGSVQWHGFLYDVTARKQQELHLHQAASVFSSTQEGVVITDPGARIVAVNPAFSRITGYAEAELLGQHMRIMQSGRQDRAFYRAMWATIAAEGHWQGEIWNRRKNGNVYPEWLTISAVHDSQGAVVNYVGAFSDITRLKESEERLRYLASHDGLTGLPNREALLERLNQAIGRVQRGGGIGAVLFLDLDRFKNVNDSFGHPAGDELLQQVSRRLGARLRQVDVLARLGGDEFVVLLEDLATPADAAKAAQGLIEATSLPFVLGEGKEACVGCSIGISLFPRDANAAHELIQHADAALYQAKAAGKGTYRFFESELTQVALRRLEIEACLRRGLERGEFELHYQPLVHLADGRARGAEALVRWRDPCGRLVSPGEFIPVAEDTGLIIPLGEWVLRAACGQMKAWLDAGAELETMAINLSPVQFGRFDLTERVQCILRETGLPARYLELEITEGALMENTAEAEKKLRQLTALGLRLAIDDFGTGYSSLAYLKRFPISKLKVDRQFVRDIPQDSADMQITAAIISLAKNLHLEVLAEGVETPAQLEFLIAHGCDTGQGYLFSKPVCSAEFGRMIRLPQPARAAA